MTAATKAFRLAMLVVALASCAASPSRCETVPPGIHQAFLWKVTGERGSIFLFGVHQTAGKGDIAPEAWAVLDASDLFVAESAEVPDRADFRARRGWQDAFELPEGRSLRDLLGGGDYLKLEVILDENFTHADLKRLKPWVAMFALAKTVFAFPSPSINEALVARASERNMETAYLDTWEDQVRYLDAAIGGAKLAQAIHDYHGMACRLAHSAAMYRAGADEAFINDIAGSDEPVVARIHRWIPKLESLLSSERRAFIAVGVGELLGPYGILVELEQRGYHVRRLRPAPVPPRLEGAASR